MSPTTESRAEMSGTNVRRDAGIDALRASLTLLVLFHHTAITYGGSGDWYYKEVRSGPELSSQLLSLFTAANQAFFIGLFFLLAGYFTPDAVERHGAAGYMRGEPCASARRSSSISWCSRR
jgi:peptidoglycan/LPS O-acetylase OafA/YrhL